MYSIFSVYCLCERPHIKQQFFMYRQSLQNGSDQLFVTLYTADPSFCNKLRFFFIGDSPKKVYKDFANGNKEFCFVSYFVKIIKRKCLILKRKKTRCTQVWHYLKFEKLAILIKLSLLRPKHIFSQFFMHTHLFNK